MPVTPARSAAFDILLRIERDASYASELLHSAVYENLSAADHALATELVMGVLRWRSRLDDEIATASSQSLSKLDLAVLIALRLAVYQFRWLDRIPHRAALHESVELVKHARKRSAAPFVNAVLRKLSTSTAPAFERPSSLEDLASTFAHPLWMVERWVKEYGLSAAHAICEHNQAIPTTAIRLRGTSSEAELKREDICAGKGSMLASARRIETGDITKTQAFRAGQIVILDEGSQLVASLVGHQAEDHSERSIRVLDCCAAPGGKTLAIADRNPGAAIIAVELHPHRARLLQRLVKAAHSSARAQVITADALHLPISYLFDRVLADVPCSGTGTLARNPEIKWHLVPADLTELHTRQSAILRSALAQVAAGGRLIYSTCSLEREENEGVIEEVLADNHSFRLIECGTELDRLKAGGELTWPDHRSLMRGPYLRTIPGVHPCDGFFAAILEKT
jgi:16S rRNA (cytosine967-C5)-methyltransferase